MTFVEHLYLALRSLRHRPAFIATVVLTLAVGIGATTAAFALLDSVLLTRLPVSDQDRLVGLWAVNPEYPSQQWDVPWDTHTLLADRRSVFLDVAATGSFAPYPFAARFGTRAIHLTSTPVSGNFFAVLGIRPEIGRLVMPDDDVHGAPDVIVLSDRLWRSDFGGDPAIVGQILQFGGGSLRIIGVAPPEFAYPTGTDSWTPVVPNATREKSAASVPDTYGFYLVGRLRPGATVSAARSELESVLRADSLSGRHKIVSTAGVAIPYADVVRGSSLRPALIVLFGAVALVLVVACTNVAGLLVARGMARETEFAIRSALGASQAQLARHVLAESILFGVAGGTLGLGVAAALVRTAVALAPRRQAIGFTARFVPAVQPAIGNAHIDPGVLAFAAAITIASVVGFGLLPALRSARSDRPGGLRVSSRSATSGPGRGLARRLLVGVQVALALVVLCGAALLGRTLEQLQEVPLGFDPGHLLFFRLSYMIPASPDDVPSVFWTRRAAFVDHLTQRVANVPGLGPMSSALTLPFSDAAIAERYAIDGQSLEGTFAGPTVQTEQALDDYFGVMQIPILRGRSFTRLDDGHAPSVAVVNEAFARRAWPGENPIDHRVQFPSDSAHRWWTVVGVAGDARYDDLSKPPPAIVYLPARQATYANPWYVIRTAGAPRAAAKVLDAVMPEVDPAFGVSRSVTGSDMLAARLARPRAFAALLSALSAIALVLVATGLFGVLSAYVRERQREIAIRGALGATPRQLRARVLAEALGAGAAGLVCGVPLAFAGSRVLGALVTDVQPVDAATALIVAAVLTVVVAAAVYGPVLRATRIDARTALSAE